jgi:signal transduction histidine kinase
MSSLVFQVGVAGPLLLGLIVFTASRREPGRVHRYLLALLGMILLWMLGMLVYEVGGARWQTLANLLLYPPACFMAPVFGLMMLLYARVELFELRAGARWAVLAPFALFLLGFATNPWHELMAGPIPVLKAGQEVEPGPLFWSFQVCSNAAALVGLGVCVWIARRSPSTDERRRMLLLCVGALMPALVHAAYTFQWLPTDEPLTPASLAVTSLLVVTAMQRYRLLDVHPVARRDVIEASSDAVIVADADECVVDLNPAALALLGLETGGWHGRPLRQVLDALGRTEPEGLLPALLQSVQRDATPVASELELADGRVLEASVGCPRGTLPGAAGCFLVLRDRTAERRAAQLLQRSQRLESVGMLAAGVAHEVNNPLAFVTANLGHVHQTAAALESRAEELPKDLLDAVHELSDVVDESIAGLGRIRSIVQGLLNLARTPSQPTRVDDPNALVSEALRYAALDGDAGIQLETRFADDLPGIEASPEQLVQVFLNLLLNARHALRGRPGALVVASTRVLPGQVEVRIEDNGPGVPESVRNRIFDPFFTTRPPNQGTGLGLSIAHDIVSEHGGTLELESPETGGACFVVRLPAQEEAASASAASAR